MAGLSAATGKRGSTYCGPTAICMLTGADREAATRALRIVTGRRAIRGVGHAEMRAALKLLGYDMKAVAVELAENTAGEIVGPTLARFLRERGSLRNEPLLINVTGHYVTVKGRKGGCSLTGGKPVWISKMRRRRARVKRAWVVRREPRNVKPNRRTRNQ
jgi:hypothetical protein